MPRFLNKPFIKAVNTYTCKAKRCTVPRYKDIPKQLRGLRLKQIVALLLLTIHCGECDKSPMGYRKKGGMFRISWSKDSVEDKIDAVDDDKKPSC